MIVPAMRAWGAPGLLVLLLLAGACGVSRRYYEKLDATMARQDYAAAAAAVTEDEYGSRSRVLFHLDRGMIYQLAEKFSSSIADFAAADTLIEELYTVSVSKAAESFIVNDNASPYEGEDFEKALLNAFQAINYTLAGELDEALVECRRVNTKLTLLNQSYEKKNVYQEDGFVRYLAGILYEARGEDNDAYISYKKARDIYRGEYREYYGTSAPPFLEDDLRRTGIRSGVLDAGPGPTRASGGTGELVVIVQSGLSPRKEEGSIMIPLPGQKIAKIAFPVYSPVSRRTRFAEISVDGQWGCRTHMVENIEAIALKNLDDRRGRAILKMGTRQALKYIMSKQLGDLAGQQGGREMGQLIGFLASAALAAAEVADIRSWRTLPAEIQIGRCRVSPGQHQVAIQPVDQGRFSTGPAMMKTVSVDRGKIAIVSVRTTD